MPVERHLRALEAALDGPMTLGELAARLDQDGRGLLVILLCLPFLQPVPLGGLSMVVGPVVAILGVQMARRRAQLVLPDWIARRRVEEKTLSVFLRSARRFFAVAEKVVRPRWLGAARGDRAAGAGIALSGALMSLPFPVPLSNMICAAPAALLALAAIEDDGVLAVVAWLALAFSVACHVALVVLGAEGARVLWAAAFP